MRSLAEIVGNRTTTILCQRPSLRVVPYVGERTFPDPTAQIAVRRAERTNGATRTTIIEFPQPPLTRKARFRERARVAINNPFADILAQFRDGTISLREFGVQRAALIRSSHKPTRKR